MDITRNSFQHRVVKCGLIWIQLELKITSLTIILIVQTDVILQLKSGVTTSTCLPIYNFLASADRCILLSFFNKAGPKLNETHQLLAYADGCTLFQAAYKQNSISVPADRCQHLAWWLLCLELLRTQETTVSPLLGCSLVSWSDMYKIQVSSIVTKWFTNPTESCWNQSKMTCEASTRSCFWSPLSHLGTHLARAFPCLKSHE
jgi:hypothetical protein